MTAFRPSTVNEYVLWLKQWLDAGNSPTHYYDYPMSRDLSWQVAVRDFTTGGECGADAVRIVVPPGIRHIGGGLGDNQLYFMDGPSHGGGVFLVPVFSDPEFLLLPGIRDFIESKAAEAREARHEFEARHRQREVAQRGSDVGRGRRLESGVPLPSPDPAAGPAGDLHNRVRPTLREKAASRPNLRALLNEIDRGRERSQDRSTEATDVLHAHEITAADAAMIRMMAGATFEPGFALTLPSGRTITGAEIARWIETNP
ncbi:hypothetical protein [Streptomyces sp. NPDC055709]